jgi:hypothetical protein
MNHLIENNLIQIDPSTDVTYPSKRNDKSGYQELPDSFLFAVKQNDNVKFIGGELNRFTENIFDVLRIHSEKEMIYIRAIENLLKQKEYLNLFYQVTQNLITDEEFNSELELNEDKYLIRMNDAVDYNKLELITTILHKINFDLTEDELSEIFSLNVNVISKIIEPKRKNETSLR